MTTTVDLWFDPRCPFTWITSRWLVGVAADRDLEVVWHLWDLGRDVDPASIPDERRAAVELGTRARRLLRAAQEQLGNEAVGRTYLEWGRRFHHDQQRDERLLADVIAAAELPPTVVDAAADPAIDVRVHADMDEGRALVGPDVGSPVLSVRTHGFERKAYFGPVLLEVPDPRSGSRLWDMIEAAFEVPALYELKRGRTGRPDLGPRP